MYRALVSGNGGRVVPTLPVALDVRRRLTLESVDVSFPRHHLVKKSWQVEQSHGRTVWTGAGLRARWQTLLTTSEALDELARITFDLAILVLKFEPRSFDCGVDGELPTRARLDPV